MTSVVQCRALHPKRSTRFHVLSDRINIVNIISILFHVNPFYITSHCIVCFLIVFCQAKRPTCQIPRHAVTMGHGFGDGSTRNDEIQKIQKIHRLANHWPWGLPLAPRGPKGPQGGLPQVVFCQRRCGVVEASQP